MWIFRQILPTLNHHAYHPIRPSVNRLIQPWHKLSMMSNLKNLFPWKEMVKVMKRPSGFINSRLIYNYFLLLSMFTTIAMESITLLLLPTLSKMFQDCSTWSWVYSTLARKTGVKWPQLYQQVTWRLSVLNQANLLFQYSMCPLLALHLPVLPEMVSEDKKQKDDT